MPKKSTHSLNDLDALFGSSRVYSTEQGRICPSCDSPIDDCQCNNDVRPTGDGIVRLKRETKGRKGKGVTLIEGLLLNANELKNLAKELKNRCGCGGTVKDGIIEIQGDVRAIVQPLLEQKGHTVKRAGG